MKVTLLSSSVVIGEWQLTFHHNRWYHASKECNSDANDTLDENHHCVYCDVTLPKPIKMLGTLSKINWGKHA